jgi:hypothetical protein
MGAEDPIATAIAAMKQAADALSDTARAVGKAAPDPGPPAPAEQAPHRPADSASQRYYDDLVHRGELVDVDDTTDLGQLPPSVTHVRMPDGRVRRIGYS